MLAFLSFSCPNPGKLQPLADRCGTVRESERYPKRGMYEAARCFVTMAGAEKTITDLKLIGDYARAIQHLAANAATVPILLSLVHLRDLVVESLRSGGNHAKKECRKDNRDWRRVKESLFRRHTPVGGILMDFVRAAGVIHDRST